MKVFDFVSALVKLVPLVRQFVDAAESLFPEGGKGKEKLDMVRGWLEEASNILGISAIAFNVAWPLINSTITTVVKSSK